MRNAVDRGTYVAPRDLTVATYLDLWMSAHEVEVNPSTAASYRARIRLYLVRGIGHELVQSLSRSRLSVLWKDLHQTGGKDGMPVPVRTVEFATAIHIHATMLLREGVPVHVVAKRIGHKVPSVTLNVYTDVIPEDDRRA